MYKNFGNCCNPCCVKTPPYNFSAFVRVKNNVKDLKLSLGLHYMYRDKLIYKRSSDFNFNQSERIDFPKISSKVWLDIFRVTPTGQELLLFEVDIDDRGQINYELVGTSSHPILRRIYC